MDSSSSHGSTSDDRTKRTASGSSIMNLNRGFTNEGDKIMDYVEHGIFDALEKQYLQKFIFAIYLDNKDPNNIVEAYTFNFDYYTVPGTDITVPIMSLGERLSGLNLNTKIDDPITEAMKKGKAVTLGEMKKSVRGMIKTLIATITPMESLPKCRYGNFKLFFTDNTPDNYQPQHFHGSDFEKDRWFFTTHRSNEVPERLNAGNMETGWHGVNVNVVSVSSYLPSACDDNAMFVGLSNRGAPQPSPLEQAEFRLRDVELQAKDAANRNVVWDADGEADAEGEDLDDDIIVLNTLASRTPMVPIGLRTECGEIMQLVADSLKPQEALYSGQVERTARHVGELTKSSAMEVDETQPLTFTQELIDRSASARSGRALSQSLPPSDVVFSQSAISSQQVETQALKDMFDITDSITLSEDADMLDMETQPVSKPDSIQAFESQEKELVGIAPGRKVKSHKKKMTETVQTGGDAGIMDCDCGVSNEDDFEGCCQCEGECKRWYHVWCIGYHSPRDKRLPTQFICFGCRLRRGQDWDLISGKIYVDMTTRYKDLAIFRRAIKMFEMYKPETSSQFRRHIGCDPSLVTHLLTRLEEEGFIAVESIISDELGYKTTRSTAKANKNSKSKQKKELQKTKYVFLQTSKRSKAYEDYFDPCPEVENRLMGLPKAGRSGDKRCRTGNLECEHLAQLPAGLESQTQAETQDVLAMALTNGCLKRKAPKAGSGKVKRRKMAIGSGVDLCD